MYVPDLVFLIYRLPASFLAAFVPFLLIFFYVYLTFEIYAYTEHFHTVHFYTAVNIDQIKIKPLTIHKVVALFMTLGLAAYALSAMILLVK